MFPQMSPDAIALVGAQFDSLRADAPALSAAFYRQLFGLAPGLRPLFPADTTALQRKLVAALAYVTAHLDRPADLLPVLRDMGTRHAGYGATPADFAPVGEALMLALAERLGAGFDRTARDAWLTAYLLIAGAMAEGLAAGSAGGGRRVA